ncbi:DUF378 domain-containing protein [Myxococcaceae bacterium GXIMD 01537]
MAFDKNNPESMNKLMKVLAIVTIIGALNWGLIGFFNFNLVDAIFGGGSRETTSALSRLIYSLVGVAGLALAFMYPWQKRVTTDTTSDIGMRRRAEIRP